jgi:hypothetical protein
MVLVHFLQVVTTLSLLLLLLYRVTAAALNESKFPLLLLDLDSLTETAIKDEFLVTLFEMVLML